MKWNGTACEVAESAETKPKEDAQLKTKGSLSAGAIVGICVLIAAVILTAILIGVFVARRKRNSLRHRIEYVP